MNLVFLDIKNLDIEKGRLSQYRCLSSHFGSILDYTPANPDLNPQWRFFLEKY